MTLPPPRRWALGLIFVSVLIGVVDGILMTWDHLQFVLQTGAGVCGDGGESACEITHSAAVAINRIPLPGQMHDMPIAILAVGCYVVVGWLGFIVWQSKTGSQRALSHLLMIGLMSSILSVALATYSLVYQGSVCPFCAVLYAASFMLLAGAIIYSRRPVKARLAEFKSAFVSRDTAIRIGAFFLVVLVTYGAYAGAIKPKPPEISQKVVQVETEGRPMLGDPSAPVHLAEFIDYGCGHCRDLSDTLHELLETRPGKVKVSILNFPLANCHEARGSCYIARAAECALKQGAYPAFSKHAFELGAWGIDDQKEKLPAVIEGLGINTEDFNQCMEDKETVERVKKDRTHGLDLGVTGTPTLFVNGRRVSGAKPLDQLEQMVDDLAAGKTP